MSIGIGIGGAWKDVPSIRVGVGGAWKQAQSVWIGVGGAWKKAWDYLNASLTSTSYSDTTVDPTDCTMGIRVNSNGDFETLKAVYATVYQWTTAASSPGDYSMRWTSTSGTLSAGVTSGTWYALSTSREAAVQQTSIGSKSCTGTLEIAETANLANVFATATITLTAQVEV